MWAESPYSTRTAGDREAGARCPHCGTSIAYGEQIIGCGRCGSVHHVVCWQSKDGCGSFECAPARRILGESRLPDLRVTLDEVDRARPPVRGVAMPAGTYTPMPPAKSNERSALSIAALVVSLCAVAALPLAHFAPGLVGGVLLIGGILGGILAVVLAGIALGGINHSGKRGTGMAVVGIVLGLAATIGSIAIVAFASLPDGHLAISIDEFEPDTDSLNHMVPTVARAVRANALIETRIGGVLGGQGIGSGVIMLIENNSALILTNRHVIDPGFGAKEAEPQKPGLPDGHLQVKLIGQPVHPGRVVWIAPDQIDLAMVRVAVDGSGAEAVNWSRDTEPMIGGEVFTIGNPQHLDWTHTRGSISQFRLQRRGDRQIHIIQTDAPLNPGNSGGGLYDKTGTLIGINTWTNDKRFSEGLGFAIALSSLLDLKPPELHEQAKKLLDKPAVNKTVKKAEKPAAKPEDEPLDDPVEE
jgi:S1-C subfamily serine protease